MTQQPPVEPDDDALRESGWTYRPYGGGELEPAPPTSTPAPATGSSATGSSATGSSGAGLEGAAGTQQFVLGLASLTAGIPVTAIAVTNGGIPALAIAWCGLVGINIAHGLARRRNR